MTKVHIATSREIGRKCIEAIKGSYPDEYVFVDNPFDSDIFISILYDQIITAPLISGRKCFNFHPGILPQYRGSGCFSWSIINGERTAGITLHEIDEGIDSGRIIEIRSFPIDEKDTAQTLFERGERVIYEMFVQWFPKLLTGDYKSVQPDLKNSKIYYRKDLDGAKDLTRYIKAFTFEGKESAYYYDKNGKKIYINYETTQPVK